MTRREARQLPTEHLISVATEELQDIVDVLTSRLCYLVRRSDPQDETLVRLAKLRQELGKALYSARVAEAERLDEIEAELDALMEDGYTSDHSGYVKFPD